MNTLILVGGLVVVGIYTVGRLVPNVAEIAKDTAGKMEHDKSKEIGTGTVTEEVEKNVIYIDPKTGEAKSENRIVPKGPYGQCIEDLNCQGSAGIGARYRCIGGECAPLVSRKTIVSGIAGNSLFNPLELNIKKSCGRYYLMGDHGKGNCSKDSQCSNSGLTCDINDPDCISSTGNNFIMGDNTYCDSQNKCSTFSNPDSLGIRWKWEDLTEQRRRELGFPNYQELNKKSVRDLSLINKCPELESNI